MTYRPGIKAYTTREIWMLRNGSAVDHRSWYAIRNKKSIDGPAQVMIYDEIGQWGISPADFAADVSKIKGDIELHLNSPGGSVWDGLAIYENLKQHSAGVVTVIIDSLAASIASVIAMAADPGNLLIARNASLMMHDGAGLCMGNASDMKNMADILEEQSQNIADIYAMRAGQTSDYWRRMMTANGTDGTWFVGQKAVDAGLADFVLGQEPGDIENKANDNNGWVARDGKWVFDPDNDGDDDGTPEGDTDHDYWSPSGKQLKPIPPKPQGDPPSNSLGEWHIISDSDVDNSPWDASKAWHNGSESKDPAAFYNGICAGEKTSGDPKTQDHWALPYRYTPSSPPNAAGVRNALARLDQTQDLKDKGAAQTKLQKLMKQINPDYDPEDQFAAMALAMKEM